MKNLKKIIVLAALFLFLPGLSFASHTYTTCGQVTDGGCNDPVDVCYEGLVPCGKKVIVGGTYEHGECTGGYDQIYIPCQFCHFLIMLNAIVNFILLPPDGLIWIIALLMIAYAGFLYVIGRINPDDPGPVRLANRVLKNTFIGLALCLGAWLVVQTIFMFINVKDMYHLTPNHWNEIDCYVERPQ